MRRPRLTILLATAIAAVLASSAFTAGYRLAADRDVPAFERVIETARELRDRAAHPLSEDDLANAAIQGMLDALGDPYAAILDPGQRSQVGELLNGSIVGIGVWLDPDPQGLRISSVVPGSPADKAGLVAADVIAMIDGRAIRSTADRSGIEHLRGPAGSPVELVVLRAGRRLEITVVRARLPVTNVATRTMEGGIGYVRVYQFGTRTSDQLRQAVQGLLAQQARAIVLDLRDNPGGLADEAFRAADVFIGSGLLATMRERGKDPRPVYASGNALRPFPMAVLTNRGTASAAEILAGALQGRDRATLVGGRTFGKGSVLSVEAPGSNGPTIEFTTAFFYTPDGQAVEGRGIRPDIAVAPGAGDPQLDRAMHVLLAGA